MELLQGHEDGINCMGVSADESVLITGSEDNTARAWAVMDDLEDLDGDRCIGIFSGHGSYITCVAVHDRFVYTGSNDATIRKWDIATTECVQVYRGHTSRIHK